MSKYDALLGNMLAISELASMVIVLGYQGQRRANLHAGFGGTRIWDLVKPIWKGGGTAGS